MNAEFLNAVLVLVYLILGTLGIALVVGWALKRFGSPGQRSSNTSALESKEHDLRKNRDDSPRRRS